MPDGKPAGVRCAQLDDANGCQIFDQPEHSAVCDSLQPAPDMCGGSATHTMQFLTQLKLTTAAH